MLRPMPILFLICALSLGVARPLSAEEMPRNGFHLLFLTSVFDETRASSNHVNHVQLSRTWSAYLARVESEAHLENAPCGFEFCPLQHRRDFLESLKGKGIRYKLEQVQGYVNGVQNVRRVSGKERCGEDNHFATPAEFFGHGGDCEDYPIAKFLLLREVGFSPDDMKVVMVWDWIRKRNSAVLVVLHDGESLVLANHKSFVTPAQNMVSHRVRYVLNGRGKPAQRQALAK